MTSDEYYNNRGCEKRFLIGILVIILLILFSCNKDIYCWDCSIKERFIDSNGVITNWYKHSFVICNETEEEIFYFEKRNAIIIDTARMLGTFIECRIK